MRSWKIKEQDDSLVQTLRRSLNCSHFFARILINRGIETPEKAKKFLHADKSMLHDPFLFCGMERAVERIGEAIRKDERIIVYGDYDVDGITATALLMEELRSLGGNVGYYIPNRFADGYGVNSAAIQKIAQEGANLIITVDTGITAVAEVEEAKALGMDIIITDHHECQEQLPDTLIINPKCEQSGYPFEALAGVGVVFKLVCALDQTYGGGGDPDRFTSFAAIGTIADIMPMVGENRYIVRRGLEMLRDTQNPGLSALIERCVGDRPIDASTVGFILAPRINAAGRMGSASVGVDLLTTRDPQVAEALVDELCKENNQRQVTENQIMEEAIAMFESDEKNKNRNAIILWDENWHNGVVGIVASRLKDRYNRPCILFSVGDEFAKGSGRSMKPFNLFEALEGISDYTKRFGGHAYAAGVLVDKRKLDAFRDAFCAKVDAFLESNQFDESIELDCTLSEKDLSVSKIKELGRLAPFGRGNDVPIFCIRNVRLLEASPTANGNHMRLSFLCGNNRLTGFYFNVAPNRFLYQAGETVDIVFEADINTYNGRQNVQLLIKDIRLCEKESVQTRNELLRLAGSNLRAEDIPSREDAATIYRYLLKMLTFGVSEFDFSALVKRIASERHYKMTVGAVLFSMEILKELGILDYHRDDLYFRDLKIHADKKVCLDDSLLLKEIKRKAGDTVCV